MSAPQVSAGTAGEPRLIARAVPVMGTVVSFAVRPGPLAEDRVLAGIGAACETLRRADDTFSTWKPESPVSRLRAGELAVGTAPPEVAEVLALCGTARSLSGGWFDPWAMPGGVDPTGLVKGWAVERALGVLRDSGAAAALVNGGGDIAAFGAPAEGTAWLAGIQHPWRPDALAGVIAVRRAVATSGGYQRGGHLIEPATGRAASRAASATVAGPSLALADALATALAVGGDEALAEIARADGYAAYLIRPDGTQASHGDIGLVS